MKVFHFILGKAAKERANGVNQVVAGLAKYTVRAGIDVCVIGKANSAALEGEVIVRDGFNVIVFSRWSAELRQAVRQAVAWADVVHLHGAYAPHNIWIGWLCQLSGKPYVVTTHNGLSPRIKALSGGIKKALFHSLVQKRHLQCAAFLHALTEEEATDILTVARPRGLAVVPNGIDLEDFPSPAGRIASNPAAIIRIGYIGRLSREKNLPALCEAFAALNNQVGNLELLLAGPSAPEADSILQRWPGVGIRLVGPRFGAEKLAFLEEIDLMVLPSLSEGFPISAAESLAAGVPMLITRTSNLNYFAGSDAFVLCEPTVTGLERGLRKALARRSDWPQMARRGRTLIETELNWGAVAAEMVKVYESATGGST